MIRCQCTVPDAAMELVTFCRNMRYTDPAYSAQKCEERVREKEREEDREEEREKEGEEDGEGEG